MPVIARRRGIRIGTPGFVPLASCPMPVCSGVLSELARCPAVGFWGQNTPQWLRGEVRRFGIGIPWLYACRRSIRHSEQAMGCEDQGWTGFSSSANGLNLVPFGSLPINRDRTVGAHHSINQKEQGPELYMWGNSGNGLGLVLLALRPWLYALAFCHSS